MNIEYAKGLLKINKYNLDDEVIKQPELFWMVAEQCAEAVSIRDEAKEAKEVAWSKAYLLEKSAGDKVTDSTAKVKADLNGDYAEALMEYLKAKEIAETWIALKESFQQRAVMLRELCGLLPPGYDVDKEVENIKKEMRK